MQMLSGKGEGGSQGQGQRQGQGQGRSSYGQQEHNQGGPSYDEPSFNPDDEIPF
jgi:single-strand DNA-binding protein